MAKKKLASANLEGIETGESARERSGMAPDQWNAAVRLQCAVRDSISRPVSLLDALNYARIMFPHMIEHGLREEFQRQFDESREIERQAKEAATTAAKKSAGKTK